MKKRTLLVMMTGLLLGSAVWAADDAVTEKTAVTDKDLLNRPLIAYPKGYELKNGPGDTLSVVDVDGKKALQFKADKQVYVRLRSGFSSFKPKTKYVMTCEIKITDMNAKNKKRGVMLQVKSSSGKPYTWLAIIHNGSTDGWVTATIPFDTGAKPAYCKSRVSIFFIRLSGTVLLRNMKITETTEELDKGFKVGEDFVSGALLKL